MPGGDSPIDEPTAQTREGAVPSSGVCGYETAFDYLRDELERASCYVRAHAIRHGGAECSLIAPLDQVTQLPFSWAPPRVDAPANQSWHDQLEQALALQNTIAQRLGLTEEQHRNTFPLIRIWNDLERDAGLGSHAERRAQLRMPQRVALLVAFLEDHYPAFRGALRQMATTDGTLAGGLSVQLLAEICQPFSTEEADPLEMFQEEWPLWRDRYLLVVPGGPDASLRRVQLDPGIAAKLLQAESLDHELQGSVKRVTQWVAWDELAIEEVTRRRLQRLATQSLAATVVLCHGPAGSPIVQVVRAVLTATDQPDLLVADVARVEAAHWADWTTRVRREARLTNSVILWSSATALLEAHRVDHRWQQLIEPDPARAIFISTEVPWEPEGIANRHVISFASIEFPIPGFRIRRAAWQRLLKQERLPLPKESSLPLDMLASFQFTEGQMADAIITARGLAMTSVNPSNEMSEHLYEACRRVSARGMVSFTQRVPPRRTGNLNPLDSVILAPEAKQQLQELNDRIQHLNAVYYEHGFGDTLSLGRGLIALFAGPSGTGKTFAASALASGRARDLYKIDMSSVISKYVGETEKNLARVFQDAQASGAMLFFDEADAIFGKRGEVDKAQDRWANMEINYLLQRVEEFSGVVILATNLKQNIDEAFLRRVHVLIDFKPPGAAERQLILKGMFPAGVTPPPDQDLKTFCELFDLTGGNLKNIAVDAAFRAFQDQSSGPRRSSGTGLQIEIEHLVLAAAREYRKLSRPVSLASFGRRFFDIVKSRFHFD